MFNKKSLRHGASLALIGSVLTGSLPAIAQQPDTTDIGTVVVTGSRIARPSLESTTPVLSIGQAEFDALGYENIADLATALPQFSPAFGASRTQSTFSGAATSGLLSFDFGERSDSEYFAGVTNVFDKDPPFFASGTSGTQALDTIPAFYDVFGRSYYAGTRVRF